MFTCEFCKKTYSSKNTLATHQKMTKKCLLSRGLIEKPVQYVCEFCDYETKRKNNMDRHNKICKTKDQKMNCSLLEKIKILENENIQLKIMLKEKEDKIQLEQEMRKFLEKELKEHKADLKEHFHILASKPNIINNNTNNTSNTKINNLIMLDMKDNSIKEKVENNFTIEHLTEGIKGVAKFTKEFIIKPENGKIKYLCTDPSRGIFKYKDLDGVVQKDVKAIKLKNSIKEPIIEKSRKLYVTEGHRLMDVMHKAPDDHPDIGVAGNQMDNLTDNFFKVKNIDEHTNEYVSEMVLAVNE